MWMNHLQPGQESGYNSSWLHVAIFASFTFQGAWIWLVEEITFLIDSFCIKSPQFWTLGYQIFVKLPELVTRFPETFPAPSILS